ncbi:hypothetical protein [Melghirimyces algeriensis]|uniref:Uncharacterized protein n=1 Tax=Melghirimyces algeriensis TaxID=910412 RepID=A0A521E8X6_9BACL|nr:hypothetical protein [Melghirimyces algeriensis]SMO80364.1 hypothetical protein SAMN06264849_108104 [Melghirimyces algeriensis]
MRLFVAILLSLLLPGTGQFVNGQRWKGVLFVALDILFIILKYTVSLIPMYLLYIVVLVDVIIVGIQIIKGKREVPSGKRYLVEVIVATIIAVALTWAVDAGMERLTRVSLDPLDAKMSKEEKQKMKEEAEAYLKEKYGKEFYVDQIKYIRQISVYTMQGHLKNDKDSSFVVEKEKGKFTDGYFFYKLSVEGREEIQPHVERIFKPMMNWDSKVMVTDQVEERFAGQDITYPELRQETDGFKQKVKVNVPVALSEQNKAEEMKKVYQMVEHFNQNKIDASLKIYYYDPSLKDEKGVDQVDFTNRKYGEYITAILEVNKAAQIRSEQDLESSVIYK